MSFPLLPVIKHPNLKGPRFEWNAIKERETLLTMGLRGHEKALVVVKPKG